MVTAHCTGHDYSQPGKPRIAWDDPAARDELVSALVNDALAVLKQLDLTAIEKDGGKAAEAVALLALVAGQDVEPAEDSDGTDGTDGRWRIARNVAPDRMISTVDTEARHAHKSRHKRQDGFKAHIIVEPDTGLITTARMTKTNGTEGSDSAVGIDLIASDTTIDASMNTGGVPASGDQLEVLSDFSAISFPWVGLPALGVFECA